jgi:hypothetical protein
MNLYIINNLYNCYLHCSHLVISGSEYFYVLIWQSVYVPSSFMLPEILFFTDLQLNKFSLKNVVITDVILFMPTYFFLFYTLTSFMCLCNWQWGVRLADCGREIPTKLPDGAEEIEVVGGHYARHVLQAPHVVLISSSDTHSSEQG